MSIIAVGTIATGFYTSIGTDGSPEALVKGSLLPRPEGQITLRKKARLELPRSGDDGDPWVTIGVEERENQVVVIRRPDGVGLVVLVKVGQNVGELFRGLIGE